MATITLPTKFAFTRVERFGLLRAGNTLRSRYTGQGQRIIYPFAVWEFEGEMPEYDGAEAAAIRAFFTKLDGIKNNFRLPVPGYTKPRSGYSSNAAIQVAAAARAQTITVSAPGVSIPFLSEGDYFTIQDELKIVTDTVALNASSQAVVNFKPGLRKSAGVGVAVTLQNPTCLMHAADDDVARWGLAPPIKHGLRLEAIEDVSI